MSIYIHYIPNNFIISRHPYMISPTTNHSPIVSAIIYFMNGNRTVPAI